MCVLASHEMKSLIVAPSDLRSILLDVRKEICTHPRLAQPDDPDVNIWGYISIMQASPIVMEDFFLLILSIPLIDKSLQMYPYRVYSLPALHPEL